MLSHLQTQFAAYEMQALGVGDTLAMLLTIDANG